MVAVFSGGAGSRWQEAEGRRQEHRELTTANLEGAPAAHFSRVRIPDPPSPILLLPAPCSILHPPGPISCIMQGAARLSVRLCPESIPPTPTQPKPKPLPIPAP